VIGCGGMKVYKNEDAIHHNRPEGIKAMYYLFKEYHFVYVEQPPGTRQPWHHHNIIHESLLMVNCYSSGKRTVS